jgi:hypothetical protein
MTPDERALATLVLQQNAVEYWYRVDLKGGEGAADMFAQDGVFVVGPGEPLVGRKAVDEFYRWRVDRGARTSRHVITNFRAEFSDVRHAETICTMFVFADDGEPVHPSAPPIFIGDQIDRCVKEDDGVWRYAHRTFTPLFMGGVAPTVPPDEIAATHNKAKSA